MKPIISIPFASNDGLNNEIEEFERNKNQLLAKARQMDNLDEYTKNYLQIPCGIEFHHFLNQLNTPLKILDIGCGRGETSFLLAQKGHEVHCVEPSLAMCEIISFIADKFSLPINVYHTVGEAIDKISFKDYDLCLFNASFHHCQNPASVLRHCYEKLKVGGKVFLLNEPILKFYRSKQWYQYALENFPEKMGHYGADEHIYYYQEYRQFLSQAGFEDVIDHFNRRLYHPQSVIRDDLYKNVTDFRILIKYSALLTFKIFVSKLWMRKTVANLLKRLSLIPVSFEATKR